MLRRGLITSMQLKNLNRFYMVKLIKSNHAKLFSSSSQLRYSEESFDALKPVKSNLISRSSQLTEMKEKRLQLIKRYLPEGETDILSEAIIKSPNIQTLLELIDMHSSVMNNRHLAEIFESFHDFARYGKNYDNNSFQLLGSPQFKTICNCVVKRIKFFAPPDTLTILKALIYLQVSPQTFIMQSVLQMARHQINDFRLEQIIFLDFLLNRKLLNEKTQEEEIHDSTAEISESKQKPIVPLVDALKLALPLVLQVKIESKELDFENLEMVVKCLRMGANRNIKDELLNKLIAGISIKIKELTINQAYSVVGSLAAIKNVHPNLNTALAERVMLNCLDMITTPGVKIPNNISKQFILSLLTSNRSRIDYYHKGMFNMVSNLVIENSEELPTHRACQVLKTLNNFDHVNYQLMDFVAERIIQKDKELVNDQRTSFANILAAFSLPSNYKPIQSEKVYETILQSDSIQFLKKSGKHMLFKLLKHFSILGYYPVQFINDCLENYLHEGLVTATNLGLRREFLLNLLPLYQGIKLELKDGSISEKNLDKFKLLIDETIIMMNNEERTNKLTSLHSFLSQGIGGEQFVANSVFTEFGHLIDHMIFMRKGDYPVAVCREKEINFLNDIKLPPECKK